MVSPEPPRPPADALREVRDRAIQATDVALVITDASAGAPIVWVNDAFTRTTGYRLEDVVGRTPASLLHGPATDLDDAARIGAAVRAGRSTTVTVLNYRRDGTAFWNQVSVSPVADDAGRVTHWVGLQLDVTDQVRHAHAQERSIEAERRARIGLALVSEVSDILSDLDDPYVLREIAGLLRHEVVAWAGFFLDDGGLRAADGIDSAMRATAGRRPAAGDAQPRPADPVQDLLDGAVEGPLELVLGTALEGTATADLERRLRQTVPAAPDGGPVTVVVHAIQGRRRMLGVLAVVPRHGVGLAGLDEHDRTVLYLVVRRVGMAVENTRLYEREHRLAETLQRAMLPEQAEIRDLDVWTYYAPSSGHAQVGGDWYDVLQVAPDVVSVVIGDVVGHDVEAAAAMGQLRSVVRSYMYESEDPATVLDRVDQLVGGMRIPRSASLVLATLTRAGEEWAVRYSRAGHLPPLLLRADGAVRLDEAGGALIGFAATPRTTAGARLRPGDALVLFTDGLIERRDRPLREGLAAVAEVGAAARSSDAAGIGEELLSRLAEAPEDDVAVVVVRVPDPQAATAVYGAPRRRRWSLPSEPASIGRARHAVVRTCAAWGSPARRARSWWCPSSSRTR